MGNNKKKKKAAAVKQAAKPIKKKRDYTRYMLIVLQALCGVLIGVCFFLYRSNAKFERVSGNESEEYTPSLYELSSTYYGTQNFINNYSSAVEDIIRYVAIRQQMESKGEFSPKKIVFVGEFANRFNSENYNDIDAGYYLEDLIKWGQKASSQFYSFYNYDFYTLEEYCDFWNITPDKVDYPKDYNPDSTFFTSFETFSNLYQSYEGKNVEDYVDNLEDYQRLSACIISSAYDLYSNYTEYLQYKKNFSQDNSNMRFYVKLTVNGVDTIFTNLDGIPSYISETKLNDMFKEMGQYTIVCPGTLSYNTNTPLEYDFIKSIIFDSYGYCYPDETKIWIGLDTSYPVEDYFYKNKIALEDTRKIIPFAISMGVISFIGALGLTVVIFFHEKKRFLPSNSIELLSDFDRMPIEASFTLFVLIVLAFFMGEKLIVMNVRLIPNITIEENIIMLVLVFIDICVASSFFFGFVRRVLCNNLFDGSIIAMLIPKFSKKTVRMRRWFWHVYDSSGVAFRTWTLYILFLVVNVFFALLLFFSNQTVLAFMFIFIFDASVGVALFNNNWEKKKIVDGIQRISEGEYDYKIDALKMHGENRELADAVNHIGLGLSRAVEISTKDEKLKADLITNVSHDIKTPLTSIINYVDLLKRINIDDERASKYISVLDEKSQRLKQLTFDLVEASKITSGNISIELIRIDFVEFLKQTVGEFEDKFADRKLAVVLNVPSDPVFIMADPRHMWRVIENLFNNVCKYALTETRVYIDLVTIQDKNTNSMTLSVKNISEQKLNIAADELTERFIRGDVSRSTEGSGLGLSIAKSLTIAQKGQFEIYLDGDLFKVTLTFELGEEKSGE